MYCRAANTSRSPVFTDGVIAENCSKMHSNKQAATQGSCSKELVMHLKGENAAFGA